MLVQLYTEYFMYQNSLPIFSMYMDLQSYTYRLVIQMYIHVYWLRVQLHDKMNIFILVFNVYLSFTVYTCIIMLF